VQGEDFVPGRSERPLAPEIAQTDRHFRCGLTTLARVEQSADAKRCPEVTTRAEQCIGEIRSCPSACRASKTIPLTPEF